jgi:hypothetical protein
VATNNVDWSPVYTQPPVALSSALMATGRTVVVPIAPIVSEIRPLQALPPVSGGYSALYSQSVGAGHGITYILPPPGTEIATFIGSDLCNPYETSPTGLTANFPVLPNRYFPAIGTQFLDFIDTSVYQLLWMPTNVLPSGLNVRIGLSTDPNVGNVDPAGNNAVFGAAVAPLISGVSTLDDSALPTDYISVLDGLPTTAGTFYTAALGVNGTLVPGALHLFRLSRRGGSYNLLDSNRGRLLLVSAILYTA